ncbi:MAG TPA: helix-turn-helix domain-containing protein [Nitrososphaera sp.]
MSRTRSHHPPGSPGAPCASHCPALHRTAITVRTWLKRFNTAGLAGLNDHPRSGRPATNFAKLQYSLAKMFRVRLYEELLVQWYY